MGVPPFDPLRTTPMQRRLAQAVRSPAGRWVGIHVAAHVDPWLLRLTRGRVSSFALAPVADLVVPGRKSGEPRHTAVLYFTQGDDVVLIASSFGREKHPAWYHNVKAHPQVTLTAKGVTASYVAREAEGDERDRLYALATRLYPGYADYEVRAAQVGRTIPVLVLRPA